MISEYFKEPDNIHDTPSEETIASSENEYPSNTKKRRLANPTSLDSDFPTPVNAPVSADARLASVSDTAIGAEVRMASVRNVPVLANERLIPVSDAVVPTGDPPMLVSKRRVLLGVLDVNTIHVERRSNRVAPIDSDPSDSQKLQGGHESKDEPVLDDDQVSVSDESEDGDLSARDTDGEVSEDNSEEEFDDESKGDDTVPQARETKLIDKERQLLNDVLKAHQGKPTHRDTWIGRALLVAIDILETYAQYPAVDGGDSVLPTFRWCLKNYSTEELYGAMITGFTQQEIEFFELNCWTKEAFQLLRPAAQITRQGFYIEPAGYCGSSKHMKSRDHAHKTASKSNTKTG